MWWPILVNMPCPEHITLRPSRGRAGSWPQPSPSLPHAVCAYQWSAFAERTCPRPDPFEYINDQDRWPKGVEEETGAEEADAMI